MAVWVLRKLLVLMNISNLVAQTINIKDQFDRHPLSAAILTKLVKNLVKIKSYALASTKALFHLKICRSYWDKKSVEGEVGKISNK